MKKNVFIVLIALSFILPTSAQEGKTGNRIAGNVYKNETQGIEIKLPPGQWFQEDKSTGPASIVVLTNPHLKPFEFSVKVFPEYLGISHAKDLESQLLVQFGDSYKRIHLEDASTQDITKSCLVYTFVSESKTLKRHVEVFIKNGNVFLLQVSAPKEEWKENTEIDWFFQDVSFLK